MVLAALTVLFFVPERKLVQEMKDINYGVSEEEDQSKSIEVVITSYSIHYTKLYEH